MWGSRGRSAGASARVATAVALAALVTSAALGQAPGDPAPGEPPPPVRAVFFGSSTTAGSGASRPERRWTSILSRRLGWIEVNRGLSSSTLAAVGGETPAGEERWRVDVASVAADVVFVMYGANDVLARVPLGDPLTPGTFRHAALVVLKGIRHALPDATLVVCTPQPSRATATNREPYDLALAEAAAAVGAVFLAAGAAFPEEMLATLGADRLHLNDAGHAALAEFFLARSALFVARPPRAASSGEGAPAQP